MVHFRGSPVQFPKLGSRARAPLFAFFGYAGGAKRQKGQLTPNIMARLGTAWAPKVGLVFRHGGLSWHHNKTRIRWTLVD